MRLERTGIWLPRPRSPGQLMLAAFALVVASWVMQNLRTPLWQVVGAVAMGLFLLALITSLSRPNLTDREVRWRGRVVGERPMTWWERFYRWLYRR